MVARTFTVVQVLPKMNFGGVERGTLEIARHLVKNHHRSVVVAAPGPLSEELVRVGTEWIPWEVGRKSPWTLRHILSLRRLFLSRKVDILHLRSRFPAWVAWLAWKSIPAQIRPRLLTTVHGLYSVSPYSAIMMKGERIIAVSRTVRKYILDNYKGVTPDRIVVIPRGIDPSIYHSQYGPTQGWLRDWYERYPETRNRILITIVARLSQLKGHEDFIRIIAHLRRMMPKAHGVIVGAVPKKKESYGRRLHSLAQELGVDNHLTWTGARKDVRDILAISNALLSLSKKPESFGRTVLEALSLGTPVVGYGYGGVGEILSELFPQGKVPAGDWKAAAQTICQVHCVRPKIDIPERYLLHSMTAKTIELYADMLK